MEAQPPTPDAKRIIKLPPRRCVVPANTRPYLATVAATRRTDLTNGCNAEEAKKEITQYLMNKREPVAGSELGVSWRRFVPNLGKLVAFLENANSSEPIFRIEKQESEVWLSLYTPYENKLINLMKDLLTSNGPTNLGVLNQQVMKKFNGDSIATITGIKPGEFLRACSGFSFCVRGDMVSWEPEPKQRVETVKEWRGQFTCDNNLNNKLTKPKYSDKESNDCEDDSGNNNKENKVPNINNQSNSKENEQDVNSEHIAVESCCENEEKDTNKEEGEKGIKRETFAMWKEKTESKELKEKEKEILKKQEKKSEDTEKHNTEITQSLTTHQMKKQTEIENNLENTPNSSNDDYFEWLESEEQCVSFSRATTCDFVALDCEGVNLGNVPNSLCLIQIACPTATFFYDCVSMSHNSNRDALHSQLSKLLESEEVVKVVHDCEKDAAALYQDMGIKLAGVLDSQIAYSFINRLSRRVGLSDMLVDLLEKEHPLKVDPPHKWDPEFWRKRPIHSVALQYARYDVSLLLEVTEVLVSRINREDILAIMQESKAKVERAIQPFMIAQTQSLPSFSGAAQFFEEWKRCRTGRILPFTPKIETDFQSLSKALPPAILEQLEKTGREQDIAYIVIDSSRPVQFIFHTQEHSWNSCDSHQDTVCLQQRHFLHVASSEDVEYVLEHVGQICECSNRAPIADSLHCVSVIRDCCSGKISGLTIQIKRVISGLADCLSGILCNNRNNNEQNTRNDPNNTSEPNNKNNLLIISKSKSGKTTLLRDIARFLAETGKGMMVVDTTNEIAGEGIVPHESIGLARRMKVGKRDKLHSVIQEAVRNHPLDVLVVDDIGRTKEVMRSIREVGRGGIQIIASMTASSFSDAAVECTKMLYDVFEVCVELVGHTEWRVHQPVPQVVDSSLRNDPWECESYHFSNSQTVTVCPSLFYPPQRPY